MSEDLKKYITFQINIYKSVIPEIDNLITTIEAEENPSIELLWYSKGKKSMIEQIIKKLEDSLKK